MMNSDFYIEAMKNEYSDDIRKIVFDLRGNAGGDDGVWHRVVSSVIDKPVQYKYEVGMNGNERLKMALSSFGDVETVNSNMKIHTVRVINPSESSIKFTGDMYLLQDRYTFSAAAAMVSALRQTPDRFIVVGEKTSVISGYTFPAILFKLKNSGIVYNLAFSYDLTGDKKNPYSDSVDIEIAEGINDYIDKTFRYDSHSKEYLELYDKYIKCIKEDKRLPL